MTEMRDMSTADRGWREIERAAQNQVLAENAARIDTPLAFGDYIAWVITKNGCTDDLSKVHRVGYDIGGDPHTTCGELIPHPRLWMQLSPAFQRSLGPCRFCEAEYARATRGSAA